MTIEQLLAHIQAEPETVAFSGVIEVIDTYYDFTPVEFKNGSLVNAAGQNSGSCRIFAFAKLHNLTQQQTLACFGDYYRYDVLQHPDKDDHQNIRNYMQTGWEGVSFDRLPLVPK
ncbi:MAG: HopJ type III effector protein [Gammaproteobacteria bacterium]